MAIVDFFTGHTDIWQYVDFFARIIVACICGAAIGFERSRRLKNAGLRTHIVVCCAAALMMIVSKYGFLDLVGENGAFLFGTNGADPARIAAQVISGISFLGAGVIFKHGASIKGLTTAAGIWATAGIGLAIGAGMYALGIFSVVLIIVIQYVMHKLKLGGIESWNDCQIELSVKEDGNFRSDFISTLESWNTLIDEIRFDNAGDSESDIYHYEVLIKMPANLTTEQIIRHFNDDKRIIRFSVIPNN